MRSDQRVYRNAIERKRKFSVASSALDGVEKRKESAAERRAKRASTTTDHDSSSEKIRASTVTNFLRIELEKDSRIVALRNFLRERFGGYFLPVFFVSLWIFCGTVFYRYHNNWPWSQAFFYTCDNGFSVGFGAFPDPNNGSRWYTIVNVLIGASLIAGALGLFVEIMLESGDVILEDEKKKLNAKRVEANSGNAFPPPEPTPLSERAAAFYKKNKTRVQVTSAFFVWIAIGTVFGVVNQDWDFTQALYFAVTSLSTGGKFFLNT